MKQEPQIILCPYCGHVQTVPETAAVPDQCDECKGLFEPLSRRATQISMGPWFIRDKKNPFRPGCSYEVLAKMAKNNRIRPTTVMRGPSTKQFWSVARNVPGIAHLLGYCHHCSAKVEPTATSCTACNAKFEEPKERNELGLAYRTTQEAAAAQRALEKEIASITGAPVNSSASGIAPAISAAPGADLLDQVLGAGGKFGGSPLLNFGSGAPAAPAAPTTTKASPPPMPAKPAAAKPATAGAAPGAPLNFAAGFSGTAASGGRAVDAFSLSGEADDTGVDDVQRKQKTASTMTWALIGFNVLLVVVVIVLFLMNKGKPANALNNDGNQNPPATAPPSTNLAASDNESNTTTPAPVVPIATKKTDPFGNPIDVAAPKTPKTNVKPGIEPRDDRNVMNAKLTEARTKLDGDDIAGAITVMRDVRDTYPAAWQPEDLSQRIEQFTAMLDNRKVIVEETRMADEVTKLLAEAKAAQTANDHTTVLRILTQVHENYPPKFHPKDITKSIIFSMKEVERKKKDGGKFFGQSTD